MTSPLNDRERKVLELLINLSGGINRPIRFRTLREAKFPEQVEAFYGESVDYLDSLANRKLQILREKGWITMQDGINTVLSAPDSN